MKHEWFLVIGAAAVAIVALAAGIYLRLVRKVAVVGERWNQAAAIVAGAGVAIAADDYAHLDWYFALSLGALAFGAVRFPAYLRYRKNIEQR